MPSSMDFYVALLLEGVDVSNRTTNEGLDPVVARETLDLGDGRNIRTAEMIMLEDNGDQRAYFHWTLRGPLSHLGGTCYTDEDVARSARSVAETLGATASTTQLDEMSHPMQPIGFSSTGGVRFKENRIVRYLLERVQGQNTTLNEISAMGFPNEEYTHFMQLIGYSTTGYGELSTSPPEIVAVADSIERQLRQTPQGDWNQRPEPEPPESPDGPEVIGTNVLKPYTLQVTTDTLGVFSITRMGGVWNLPPDTIGSVQDAVQEALVVYLEAQGFAGIEALYESHVKDITTDIPEVNYSPTLWEHLGI